MLIRFGNIELFSAMFISRNVYNDIFRRIISSGVRALEGDGIDMPISLADMFASEF